MKRRDFFRFAAAAPLAVVPAGLALATPTPAECKHLFVASWGDAPKPYEWPTPLCLHCGLRLPLNNWASGVVIDPGYPHHFDPGHTHAISSHTHSFTKLGGYTHG